MHSTNIHLNFGHNILFARTWWNRPNQLKIGKFGLLRGNFFLNRLDFSFEISQFSEVFNNTLKNWLFHLKIIPSSQNPFEAILKKEIFSHKKGHRLYLNSWPTISLKKFVCHFDNDRRIKKKCLNWIFENDYSIDDTNVPHLYKLHSKHLYEKYCIWCWHLEEEKKNKKERLLLVPFFSGHFW